MLARMNGGHVSVGAIRGNRIVTETLRRWEAIESVPDAGIAAVKLTERGEALLAEYRIRHPRKEIQV